MPTWTRSACVVLAWSSLLIILTTIGGTGSVHPAHPSTRTATSSTEVILTSLPSAPAAPWTAAKPPVTKYVVQDGDTLSSIASRFAVHGGWRALYAANRHAIGADPNMIHPGTVLGLPGRTAPARYTVAAGDTLSGIAARLALPGGWAALYAANRHVIGADPDAIRAGTVLTIPGLTIPGLTIPGSPAAAPPGRTPSLATRPHLAPPPPAPSGTGHHGVPRATGAPSTTEMPTWLKLLLLAVGLLVLQTFLAEALVAVARRHRQPDTDPAAQVGQAALAASGAEPPARPGAERPRIILADHDRLVVTCDKQAGRVFVLRPPGEDPRMILRVARVVLPEGPYGELAKQLGELAKQLGVPAMGPVE